ncbi:MAG: helix-turn-helix domain-containing protein [Pirellulaceae bacterium]|nr:helix-turn-helix domain-containing protein [Pirellulaceae bacterium]
MPQTTKSKPKHPVRIIREVMNLAETAKYLRLPGRTIERLVAEQGLPGRKIGKEWRFSRQAIERWLDPASALGASVLDQFGMFANDPDFEAFQRQLRENRKRWDEEVT